MVDPIKNPLTKFESSKNFAKTGNMIIVTVDKIVIVNITKIVLLLFWNLAGNTAFTASTADAPQIATPTPDTKPSVTLFLKKYEIPTPKQTVNRTIKKMHQIGR